MTVVEPQRTDSLTIDMFRIINLFSWNYIKNIVFTVGYINNRIVQNFELS